MLLNASGVAALLGVSRQAIDQRRQRGAMPEPVAWLNYDERPLWESAQFVDTPADASPLAPASVVCKCLTRDGGPCVRLPRHGGSCEDAHGWRDRPEHDHETEPTDASNEATAWVSDVLAVVTRATAHNFGRTVVAWTETPRGVEVVMSSWPRADEARRALQDSHDVSTDGPLLIVRRRNDADKCVPFLDEGGFSSGLGFA